MFAAGSPPPSLAATSTARRSFANWFDRFASFAAFFRLIVAHFECPDIAPTSPGKGNSRGAPVSPTSSGWNDAASRRPAAGRRAGPRRWRARGRRTAHVLDPRSADEHALNRVVDPVDVHVGLERIDLPPVGVAANRDVHQREQRLAVDHPLRHHDHPGARAEDRHPVANPLPDRTHEVAGQGQLGDRRGLPARDHEAVHVRELSRRANLDGGGSERREHADVLAEVALQGEDARLRHAANDRSPPTSSAREIRLRSPASTSEVPEPHDTGDGGHDPGVQRAPERLRCRGVALLGAEDLRVEVVGQLDRRIVTLEVPSDSDPTTGGPEKLELS